MSDLLIPFAVDETGQVFSPVTAPRNKSYLCPDCKNPVGVRRRDRANREEETPYTPHFYHLTEVPCTGTGESYTHKAAKGVLLMRLQQELTTLGGFHLAEKCKGHQGGCSKHSLIPTLFPMTAEEWEHVRLEVAHPTDGPRFRFDVAIVRSGQVVIGFEVFHRHKVPEEKAAALDVPWFELTAEDILEGKPLLPYEADFSHLLCASCQDELALVRIREENERRKQDIKQQRKEQQEKFRPEVVRVKGRWEVLSSREQAQRLKQQYQGAPPKKEPPSSASAQPLRGKKARSAFEDRALPPVAAPHTAPAPSLSWPAHTTQGGWLETAYVQGMEGHWETKFRGRAVWLNPALLPEGVVVYSKVGNIRSVVVVDQGTFLGVQPSWAARGNSDRAGELAVLLENINHLGRCPDGEDVIRNATLKMGEVGWVMFQALKVLADSLPT